MYKAIRTSVISVEPGKVTSTLPNRNVTVETEPLAETDAIDKSKNCVVLSLESGPHKTITDHALNLESAEDLFYSLMGCLCAVGHPIAMMLRDALPRSTDEVPAAYLV